MLADLKVHTFLSNYAAISDGLLTAVGGGWSFIGPDPSPYYLAGFVKVPWDRTNEKHVIEFVLVDEDGQPYFAPDAPADSVGLQVQMHFEVGREPGVRAGTEFSCPFAFGVGPLPFQPGRRYVWQVTVNGSRLETADLTYTVRPLPPHIRLAG